MVSIGLVGSGWLDVDGVLGGRVLCFGTWCSVNSRVHGLRGLAP